MVTLSTNSIMQEIKFSINPTISMYENGINESGVTDVIELTKERFGYFQSWGYRIHIKDNIEMQESVAIVVEAETGRVFMINPTFLSFPKYNASTFE